MGIWLENVYNKNVVHETPHQIHKNMDLSTTTLLIHGGTRQMPT